MDISKLSPDELYGYLGVPVKVEFNTNDDPVFGNVYTIDPETHSIVLGHFDNTKSTKPSKIMLVPGTSIKLMHELSDEDVQPGCVSCSTSVIEEMDKLVSPELSANEEDGPVVEDRLKRLIEGLTAKKIPFTLLDDKTVQVGPVRIEKPYKVDNFMSTNVVALKRTKGMLTAFVE